MSAKNNVQIGFYSRALAKILLRLIFSGAWVILLLPQPLTAAGSEWSRIEQELALEQQALEVNEGELQLLEAPPEAASHFHHTRLLLTEQSLLDGWVTMYQCHSDLDRVASTQIVYHKDRISNIRVVSSQNIGSAWVEGSTVQMKDIAPDSKICISADRRALSYAKGRYYLRLGPFIRRFLDGYYPMHVRVEVCYPKFLRLVSSSPVKALQYEKNNTAYADIDIWVVGKLHIELVFAGQ
jgi:hypothetical protein